MSGKQNHNKMDPGSRTTRPALSLSKGRDDGLAKQRVERAGQDITCRA